MLVLLRVSHLLLQSLQNPQFLFQISQNDLQVHRAYCLQVVVKALTNLQQVYLDSLQVHHFLCLSHFLRFKSLLLHFLQFPQALLLLLLIPLLPLLLHYLLRLLQLLQLQFYHHHSLLSLILVQLLLTLLPTLLQQLPLCLFHFQFPYFPQSLLQNHPLLLIQLLRNQKLILLTVGNALES